MGVVEASCPICHARDAKLIFRDLPLEDVRDSSVSYKVAVVQCLKCSTCYLSPRLSDEDLKYFYEQSDLVAGFYANWPNARHRVSMGLFMRQMLRRMHGKRLLDFGCGMGTLSRVAKENGLDVVSYDIGAITEKFAREVNGVEIVHELNDTMKGNFDAVALFDVIEHVTDPIGLLKYLATFLAPPPARSALFINTPNFNSVFRWVQGAKFKAIDARAHLIYFTESSLTSALREAGFRVKSVGYWGQYSGYLKLPFGHSLFVVAERDSSLTS